MNRSATPSFVLRKYLFRRSASVSPPPGHVRPVTRTREIVRLVPLLGRRECALPGLFFGCRVCVARGCIALKARVLVQRGPGRIGNRLTVDNLLVVGFARIRLTQEPHPFALGLHDHHILVTMRLLLPTVVRPLVFLGFSAAGGGARSHQ